MKTSRVVSVVLVLLLCVALVLAASHAEAGPSPKATASKANAAVRSTFASGRSTIESGLASSGASLRASSASVRAATASAGQLVRTTWSTVLQSLANAWRSANARVCSMCRSVRAAGTQCVSKATQVCDVIGTRARAVAAAVAARMPACVKPFAHDAFSGAASVVMVRQHFNAQAAGGIPDSPASRSEAIWSYTTAKFVYGLSAGLTEVALLRVLYRQPHGNHRANRFNRFFASPLGWPILVALVAIPNGLVEAGMLIVMVAKLSPSSFRPAITVGHLIRPYVVAVLRTCPHLARLGAAYKSMWPSKALVATPAVTAAAEVALWAVVMWAVMFLVAATNKASTEDDVVLDSDADSLSEEEDGEAVAPVNAARAPKAAAKKPRAKTPTRKARKSARGSSRR